MLTVKKNKNLIGSIYRESTLKHILVIAGLCHDLSGKQSHETNEVSAMYAKEFALLHDLKKSEADIVHWIVENQDLLIATAQTLDINDPEVIKNVAKQIRTEAKLNALYCFTVADLMATNDQCWNEWQESLLTDLYISLRNALKNGIENVFEQRIVIRENKDEALKLLLGTDFNECDVKRLWATIPSNFFNSNQVNEIVEFTSQVLNKGTKTEVVSLSEDTSLECSNLLVYAKDRSMLFVDLFNTLSSLKVRVKEAQLYKTKDNNVLEVIKILDHNDEAISDSYRSAQITQKIAKVLSGVGTVQKPVKPKFVKNFENSPEIEFLQTPKADKILLRVNALDNPSLIEKICNVFQQNQLTVHSAKISSLGECSENVFAISTQDSSKISGKDKSELAQMLLNDIA